MFIALAIAELGSAAPTSGGLYYWTWTFATPRWRKVLSWTVGCEYTCICYQHLSHCLFYPTSPLSLPPCGVVTDSNSMGLIAGLASIDWGCAVQLMAAVSIGSDETFVPTTGQT